MTDKPDTSECGPECDCETTGLNSKGKIIVCLVIGLAAAGVLARGFINKSRTDNNCDQASFPTTLPLALESDPAAPENKATESTGNKQAAATLWGDPLESLASLNTVAAEKDAVFVLLHVGSDEEIKEIKKQIDAAAKKITAQGSSLAAFSLNNSSEDYASITNQIPAPCVLAIVKGCGMKAVSKNITEADLIQAMVAASRPSGCGPSGCGPAGCK